MGVSSEAGGHSRGPGVARKPAARHATRRTRHYAPRHGGRPGRELDGSIPMRVLVVDDDPDFRSYVLAGLKRAGIDCEGAADGPSAKELLDRVGVEPFDLILLDVKMPGQSGWDLLLEMRELGRETPVVFLSGLDSIPGRVKGLRLGADDYIAKEFEFDELTARIGAVIRRRRTLAPIEYADLKLDLAKRTVWRGGHPIGLSPREFDL